MPQEKKSFTEKEFANRPKSKDYGKDIRLPYEGVLGSDIARNIYEQEAERQAQGKKPSSHMKMIGKEQANKTLVKKPIKKQL